MPRRNEGPVMYWYGWIGDDPARGSGNAGFLATLLPENVTRKIPLFLLWVLPLLAVPILVWYADAVLDQVAAGRWIGVICGPGPAAFFVGAKP